MRALKAIPVVKYSKGPSDPNYSGPGFDEAGWYILIDRPGAGHNTAPDGPYRSMAAAVGRLDAFCKDRGLDNTI